MEEEDKNYFINELEELLDNIKKQLGETDFGKSIKYEIEQIDFDKVKSTFTNIEELKQEKFKNIETEDGVYFVCKSINYPLKFRLNSNPKEKSYNIEDLKAKIENTTILYIGKAEGNNKLRNRIKQFIKTGENIDNGQKKKNQHNGGKAIWQIDDYKRNEKLSFCWINFEEAAFLESLLIINYQLKHNGKFPFANWKN